MAMQIIMRGNEELPLLKDAERERNISAFCAVLNFKSKISFKYYCSGMLLKDIIQDAVKNASPNISHILYLGEDVILADHKYNFEEEREFDMIRDGSSWDTCKFCLIRVNKQTRLNIEDVEKVKEERLDKSKLLYNPSLLMLLVRLLECTGTFDDAVNTIRVMHTKIEKEETPRLFIGTPCFGAQVSCNYATSLAGTIDLLRENKIDSQVHFLPNQIVTRARNILSYEFLSGNFTHLLFIDADIEWDPKDVLKLINHKKDIVVGLYANKSYQKIVSDNEFKKIQYSSTFFDENNVMDENRLMEIKHGATGFMLISRNVFEKVIDQAPAFKYNGHMMNDFFPCKVVDEHYLTEDYSFCQMWREKGGKIWADLSICLNHEGWHSYHGNPLETFSILTPLNN